jgi:hypothetical protein
MTMATRTRYFVIVSLLVLTIGLGTGLVAYYVGFPIGATQGGPEELTLVPRDAVLVAYADVHAVMVSEVRQRILQLLPQGNGQQDFENQTGIKIDTDVDRVVACLAAARPNGQALPVSGMAIVRGRFNAPKIEALMREHGANVETYKGTRLLVAPGGNVMLGPAGAANSISLAFIDPGLVAVGSTDLIRAAVDLRSGGENVTGNESIMNFVRTFEADNAWAVGQFDALTTQAKLPPAVAGQLPPITWFAVSGHVNSGLSGLFQAVARDEDSANSLRDLVRGVVAFAKLQTGAHPELQPMADSLQPGGTGKNVTLSFDVSPQMFDLLATTLKGLQGRPATRAK